MKYKIISDLQDFLRIRKEWNDLFEASEVENIFLTWDWCWLWWKHFSIENKHQLLVIIASDEENNSVIGIAPLMLTTTKRLLLRFSEITFIGHDMAADYMDFIVDFKSTKSGEIVSGLLSHSLQNCDWDKVELKRLQDSTQTHIELEKIFSGLEYRFEIGLDSISPKAQIKDGWDKYISNRSKSLRQDLRTSKNKLKSLGFYEFVHANREDPKSYLETLSKLHKMRQSSKVGKSLFEDLRWSCFLLDLFKHEGTKKFCSLSELRLQSKSISSVMGFRNRGIFFYWIPAIDPLIRGVSVGKLHIEFLMTELADDGGDFFDFMIGDEPYKSQWSLTQEKNFYIIAYKNVICWIIYRTKAKFRGILVRIKNRSNILQYLWVKATKISRG